MLTGVLIGFGVGALSAAWVAYVAIRRHLRRVRAAERRARTAERLAEIGAMTSGLAHEIKNPLSTIGLNVQLLAEAIGEQAIEEREKARLLNRARALARETERLSGILQDFLQFAGQIVVDRRPVDVNGLVEELVDFYMPEAERQGVLLRADLPGKPIVAEIDAKLIKQAVLNLMINATQAMSLMRGEKTEGGRQAVGNGGKELILRLECVNDLEIRASNANSSRFGGGHEVEQDDDFNAVCIHVIDTGPGISDEMKAKLFQPYFTTKAGGSGLGLATSRRLVQEHAGRIDLHTEVGKGSDFTAVLPRWAAKKDDAKDV